ncbi:pimeloyl-ACP methyl ester carboxylesterase [Catenulispora sp. MAP12-49]|uniref:alpha/beta hydrolase n=1 Tax=Catenulispora sp. MAP12-49 TaxID=3156302 RepID=UPI0035180CAF
MHESTQTAPTIVLVHGAFTGASSWAGVISLLHAAGLKVRAPANPLRGLAQDAAYISRALCEIDGPVVLVGHDYSGAIITHAATNADNVVALCYIAAFGLDTGENVIDVTNRFAPAPATDAIRTTALLDQIPGGQEDELYIRREQFPEVYAADLPATVTDVLSVAQRPIACSALTGRSGPPAWASKPSWYGIATADKLINPTAQRFMAQRMAATEHVLHGSHAVVLSQPAAVVAMIQEAAESGLGRSI